MAVEIPVVIDIDAAFAAAAKRVPSAVAPLRDSIEKLNEDLSVYKDFLNTSRIDSADFKMAAKEIQNIAQALEVVNDKFVKMSTNEGSIKQMTADLASLNRRWEEMGAAQKFTVGGELSADAKQLRADYAKITAELQKQGKTLAQMEAEEQRVLRLRDQGASKAQYENAILNARVKTIRVLSEQQRILSERMSRTVIGSDQYKAYAASLKQINYELKQAKSAQDRTAASHAKATAAVNKQTDALRRQSSVWVQLRSLATMYFSIFGGLRFIKNVRDTTAELELQQVALGGILRNTEKAGDLFRDIKAAALKSPFEIKDLLTYTKQLSAYRIEEDKLFDVTMRLADVSAGLGVDMNRLILAYGQVRAASVLRGQELRQFTEAGIPLVDLLAKKFKELGREGTTTADVFELISKRAVPFSMIEEIFIDMTKAGGMFYNMQEKQSETLKGKWMKLKDAITIMYDEIGNSNVVHRAMTDFIDNVTALTKAWRETGRWIAAGISSMITYTAVAKASAIASQSLTRAEAMRYAITKKQTVAMPALIAKMVGETTAKATNAAMTKLLTTAQFKLAAANTVLEKSFWRLTVAILSNPYAAAGAAIAGLIMGIIALVKNSKEAEISADALQQSISRVTNQAKKSKDILALADKYDELSQATERSKEQQDELNRVTKELAKSFPKAISGINEESGALEVNTEKVRELTRAELELEEARLRSAAKRAEERIIKLEGQREKILKRFQNSQNAPASGGYYSPGTDSELDEWAEKLEKINDELDQMYRAVERVREIDFVGPMPAEKGSGGNLSAWKQKIKEIQDAKVAAGAATVFSPDDIENFESVLKFSKELKKQQDEYNQSLKTNQELLKTATDLTKDKIQADITSDQETLKMIEAMRAALGIIFKTTGGSRSDSRLSDLKKDISEITNAYKKFLDLRKYMGVKDALGEINLLFPQLSGWEPTFENTIEKLQKMREEVSTKLARSPKDKTLLEMQRALDTEISNLKFDALKKKVDDEWKRISDELKRSETARNFYNNILGLTGDQDLAANITMSVYGGVGEDFKERLQRELYAALKKAPAGELSKEVSEEFSNAISTMDTAFFRQNLDKLPENIRETFSKALGEAENFNAKWVEDILKTYEKTKDFEERITDIRKREAEARKQIQESALPEDEKGRLIGASLAKEERDVADVEVEALKSTDEWIRTFEDLDKVGTMTLEKLISMLEELIDKNGASMNAGTLRSLTKSLEQAKEQVYTRSPFTTFTAGAKSYVESISAIIRARKRWKKEDDPEAQGALAAAYDQRNEALEKMKSAVDGVSNVFNNLNTIVSSTTELLNLDELSDGQAVLSGIATGLGLVGTALTFINAVLTLMETNPIVLAISGVVAAAASIGSILSNIRVNRANREIETQSKLLEDLEYQYGRLETAIAKSFGSDYITNYNQQIDTLLAKQEAYMKQAEAERSKGKKADEDKIKEYTNNARAAADQIADMQTQLSEFFSGTDLTSAAKDFASAWIDAYKEFGSVTDAMGEKFRDMIQEMVQNSVAAQVMQQLLQPIFDEIDTLAREGGELSVEDIAAISKLASDQIPAINDAMTTLMNSLRAAGYNLREQPGQFTGISRNVANATEESITGLAAGINTQNFYISMINQNVAAILAVISGGAVPAEGGVSSVQFNNELALQHLSGINDKLSSILNQLDKVIKPTSVSAQYYVAVRQ